MRRAALWLWLCALALRLQPALPGTRAAQPLEVREMSPGPVELQLAHLREPRRDMASELALRSKKLLWFLWDSACAWNPS